LPGTGDPAIRRDVLKLLYHSTTGVKTYDLLASTKEARPGGFTISCLSRT
jgi:hypothetical protein